MGTRREGRSGRLPGRGVARRVKASPLEGLEPRVLLATFVVNSTRDVATGSLNPGEVTLREAILAANATPGPDDVLFDVGGPGPYQILIDPGLGTLPDITDQVIIDGYSQPGSPPAQPNTLPVGSDAILLIEVVGTASLNHALRVTSADNTITGLVIRGFDDGIQVEGPGATGNLVAGNYIGTDASGTIGLGNGFFGVVVRDGASQNTVGGTTPGDRNVISGNGAAGVFLEGLGTSGNVVAGNFVGIDASGSTALGNGGAGVGIIGSFAGPPSGPTANTIGGLTPGTRNVISANGQQGINLNGAGVVGNLVAGNYVGLDAAGTAALGNTESGVAVAFGPTGNTVGGAAAGAGNVISGNVREGVFLGGANTSGNVVLGNTIGLDAAGTAARPNGLAGVGFALGPKANTIGGLTAGARNIISGNVREGVFIGGFGTSANVVVGNRIGTNEAGTVALGNALSGVVVGQGASGNTIGGATAGARNVISGNGQHGVSIDGGGSSANVVLGNAIGTNAAGFGALGNLGQGVRVAGTSIFNRIGVPGAGNLISGNRGDGVEIAGTIAVGNVVASNLIGTDVSGTAALGNGFFGVVLRGGSSENTIGGVTPGDRNVISGNGAAGVFFEGLGTSGNLVAGNLIGTNATGVAALGNTAGVAIIGSFQGPPAGPTANTIGGLTPGARNVISGNSQQGISLNGAGVSGNLVVGNDVGTNAAGTAAIPNAFAGVAIAFGPTANTVGGATPGARNVVSGNTREGVFIGPITSGNVVLGNYVGTNAAGTAAIPNVLQGVGVGLGAAGNTVGGPTAGARNVISGNVLDGVGIFGGSPGNLVVGNAIGLDAGGTVALGNGRDGVRVEESSFNTIGGIVPGLANRIAHNAGAGVGVRGPAVTGQVALGNAILGNSIFDDGGLGIDLVNGANNGQEAPTLAPLAFVGPPAQATGLLVSGTLAAQPGLSYRVEIFADAGDPSGFGEGRLLLGSVTVTADPSGLASFSASVPLPAPGLVRVVSATATSLSTGDTSEFSRWVEIPTDLAITKAAPSQVLPGQQVTFTLLAGNFGPYPASGVVITDTLPAGFQLVEATASRGTVVTSDGGATVGGVVSVTVGDLAPGELVTVTIVAIAPTTPGTYVNTARIDSQTPDVDPDNDIATATILVVDPTADLVMRKQAPASVLIGDSLTYTLTVTNAGPSLASGVVITDNLPDEFIYVDAFASRGALAFAEGVLTVSVGDLAPGEFLTVTIVGRVESPGTLVNTAIVRSSTDDPDPANDTATTTTEVIVSFVVTNTEDRGAGSLRQAIITANLVPGRDTITFLIPAELGTTIRPLSPLPAITEAVVIAGLSQPSGRVELDGSLAGFGADGLVVIAGNSVIAGLTINRFSGSGLVLIGPGGNFVAENRIGTDVLATTDLGNGLDGIRVLNSAANQIRNNVLSGNRDSGVRIAGPESFGNVVAGNLVGTTFDGMRLLGNHNAGVLVTGGAGGNTIGGLSPDDRNVLSGNRNAGVVLLGLPAAIDVPGSIDVATLGADTAPTSGNLVIGNDVGVARGGVGVLANGQAGIIISESPGNTVGGAAPFLTNTIAAGFGAGILIVGVGASGNLVIGNAIGVRPGGGILLDGTVSGSGIVVAYGARANTIGGAAPGAGNTIGAHDAAGVRIGTGAANNVVAGNRIGAVGQAPGNGVGVLIETGASGTDVLGNRIGGNVFGVVINPIAAANRLLGNAIGASAEDGTIGNVEAGLILRDSRDNTVGGTGPFDGNVISGNGVGVLIEGVSAGGNRLLGNTIGLDRAGVLAVPNASVGVFIDGGRGNTIGGIFPGEGNLISGNGTVGVEIRGLLTTGNLVVGNRIGTRPDGPTAAPNGLVGVFLDNAPGNTIGGTTEGTGNVISGNGVVEIQLSGIGASSNLVAGNVIGAGALGFSARVGAPTGLFLEGAPGNTIGGVGPDAGNLISGHEFAGAHLVGPGTSGNLLLGNRIGTDAAGTASVPNEQGITVDNAPGNTIGGAGAGAGNLLSGNLIGLVLAGARASGNLVQGNLIGTDADGQRALSNLRAGVFVNAAPGNTIGGTAPGAGNVISGNGGRGAGEEGVGLQVFSVGSAGNLIQGNRIGVDRDATRAIPNTGGGLFVNDAPGNTVGGPDPGAGNLISGNRTSGLVVFGANAADNLVQGNTIGTPRAGDPADPLGNDVGLFITGLGGSRFAGPAPEQANTIRGNRVTNVLIVPATSGPVVTLAESVRDPSGAIVAVRVGFSEELDPRRAGSLGNYRLASGSAGGPAIPIAGVTYEEAARSVTLALAQPLPANASFVLTVVGRGPGGLANLRGIRLDGNADGRPGDNFIATFRNGELVRSGAQQAAQTAAVSPAAVDSIFDAGNGLRLTRRRG